MQLSLIQALKLTKVMQGNISSETISDLIPTSDGAKFIELEELVEKRENMMGSERTKSQ
jgi:hypothetical protein